MRRVVALVAALAAGLAAATARSDSLGYANGDTVHGTLKEVTFRAGESLGVYSRGAIQSVGLSSTGGDTLVFVNGGPREGEVVSVRFAAEKGVITVPRKVLSVIGLTPTETPAGSKVKEATPKAEAPKAEPPKEPPAPEPSPAAPKLSAEQQELVLKNFDLRNHFWDEAGKLREKEVDALKEEYEDDCTKVVRAIDKLEDTIRKKEREREEAERDYRRDLNYQAQLRAMGRGWRRIDPPTFKDGLEDDRKALRQEQDQKRKLQQTIRNEMEKLAKRAADRRKRVEVAYTKQKLALEAGQAITREQMIAAYQEAIAIGDYEPPVPDTKGKDAKDEKDDKKAKKEPERKQPKK